MIQAEKYQSLWTLRRSRRDPVAFLRRLGARGDCVPFAFREQRVVLVSEPALIEDVLVTSHRKFVKSPALTRATRLLGQGLLTVEGPLHAERRRLVQPAFHRERLAAYAGSMVARAAVLRERWQSGVPFDMFREMNGLTLAIVGETLFTADLARFETELRESVAAAVDGLDPLLALVAPMRRLAPARRRLLAIVETLILERLASAEVPGDLLDQLLAARDADASAEQLRDDALTLLLAGHDTISNALTWTWILLAGHPDVDARLAKELHDVLGDRLPNLSDVPRLVYTRAVLSESLRLRPPAWIIARRAVEAHRLGSTDIAVDAIVLMSPYVVHRDARFFDAPDEFVPARWMDPSARSRPKLSYFPFGAGRRACIGESFAWMEGVLVLATLAQRWRCTAMHDVEMEPRITLRPRGPVMMTASERVGVSA